MERKLGLLLEEELRYTSWKFFINKYHSLSAFSRFSFDSLESFQSLAAWSMFLKISFIRCQRLVACSPTNNAINFRRVYCQFSKRFPRFSHDIQFKNQCWPLFLRHALSCYCYFFLFHRSNIGVYRINVNAFLDLYISYIFAFYWAFSDASQGAF